MPEGFAVGPGITFGFYVVVALVHAVSAYQPERRSLRARRAYLNSTEHQALREAERICLSHFHSCWHKDERQWARADNGVCKDPSDDCEDLLCFSWLPENCGGDAQNCQQVAAMCEVSNLTTVSMTGDSPKGDLPVLFLHMPKNAGSAIEESGIQSGVRWGKFMMTGRVQMPDGYFCNKWHVPPVYLPDPRIYDNAEVFCVVRHPFDRVISEYRYIVGQSWGGNYVRLPDEEYRCHPKGLNQYLKEVMLAVNAGYPFIKDCHMLKQSTYIWGQDRQWCKDIIRIENLSHDFDKLMKRTGYNVPLLKETSEMNVANSCENLTRDSLDPELKRVLYQYYKEDFERLNFSVDDS